MRGQPSDRAASPLRPWQSSNHKWSPPPRVWGTVLEEGSERGGEDSSIHRGEKSTGRCHPSGHKPARTKAGLDFLGVLPPPFLPTPSPTWGLRSLGGRGSGPSYPVFAAKVVQGICSHF